MLLQATAAGKPIVSLDDFDGYLAGSGAGIPCVGDVDAASKAVREFWSGERVIDEERTRQYLLQNHTVEAVAKRLTDLLTHLVQEQNLDK